MSVLEKRSALNTTWLCTKTTLALAVQKLTNVNVLLILSLCKQFESDGACLFIFIKTEICQVKRIYGKRQMCRIGAFRKRASLKG